MIAALKFFLGQDDKEDGDDDGDDDGAPPPSVPTREDVYKANSKVGNALETQWSGVCCSGGASTGARCMPSKPEQQCSRTDCYLH